MHYEFETKEKITSCEKCPCNYLDGHQNYCKLLNKFDVDKSINCPLMEVTELNILGGTNND